MNESLSLGAVFLIGLLGSSHCLAMCGGIMATLSLGSQNASPDKAKLLLILSSYNMGRISSYMIAGFIAGLLGLWLQELHSTAGLILRLFSAILLILMGFYLTGWWRLLARLERVGEKLWQHIQPFGSRLMPIKSPLQAFMLGLIWGWLPCGMVYSVLSLAATSGDIINASLIMLFFGLGTLPALMATGFFAQQLQILTRYSAVRISSGLLIILFGLWTLWGSIIYGTDHSSHQQHDPAANPVNSQRDNSQHHHH